MNERMMRLLVVTTITLVFGGCAIPQSGEPGGGERHNRGQHRENEQVCNGANCQIDVRIDCDASGACIAVVDPKVLLVMSAGGPKIIHWKLTGSSTDYEFKDVEVIPGQSEFQCQAPGPHKKEAMCKDVFGGGTTSIEYTVHVVKSSGGPELAVDPWIVNR